MNSQQRRIIRSNPNNQSRHTYSIHTTPTINIDTQNSENSSVNDGINNGQHTPRDDKRKWQHTDTIACMGILVNIIMLIVTYRLFSQTTIQATQSINSSKAAITADSIAKIALDSSKSYQQQYMASQKEAEIKSNIADKEKFKRDMQLLGLQSKAIEQTQKEFEKENEPFIQVVGFNKIVFSPNSKISFDCVIANMGKRPAVIKGISQKIDILPKKDSIVYRKNAFKTVRFENTIGYLTKELPTVKPGSFFVLTQKIYDDFIENKILVQYDIEIKYVNSINGKKMIFKTIAYLDKVEMKSFYVVYVDNAYIENHVDIETVK